MRVLGPGLVDLVVVLVHGVEQNNHRVAKIHHATDQGQFEGTAGEKS